MANPLQEQLLKAGLVSKKQLKKVKHDTRVSKKLLKAGNAPAPASKVGQEQAAQKKRINELNRQRAEEKEQRARLAQIKQLVEQNRMEKDDRCEAYNFIDEKKIKRIFVSEEIVDQLSCGQAAIVKFGGSYEVVPAKVAGQIACRDAKAVLVFHKRG